MLTFQKRIMRFLKIKIEDLEPQKYEELITFLDAKGIDFEIFKIVDLSRN